MKKPPSNGGIAKHGRPFFSIGLSGGFALYIMVDLALMAIALLSAYALRFNFAIPDIHRTMLWSVLPSTLAVETIALVFCGCYRVVWRYFSATDIPRFAFAFGGAACVFLAMRFGLPFKLSFIYPPISVIFINAVVASLNAGAGDEYDLIGQYSFSSAIGTVRGCYVNLKDIRYLDFNSPWWPNDIVDSCVINGKVYFTAGDISCTLIRNMQPILTNLDLAESLKCDNFYDLVRNQDWTAEKFMTYAYGTVTGLNPDGSEPCTTTLPNNVCYDNVFYAGGFKYVDITAEGPKMSESLESNNLTDWYDLWYSFVHDHSDVAVNKAINSENGFTSGNVLFHFGSIGDVQNYLQDITFKFGILPFPKYDKNQENYRTICGAWVSYYSIPTNAPDMDMSGAILEALGSYGYRVITPAVYTISFQYRFLNSQENAEVFELLHDTLVFDLGRQLGDQLNCFAAFRQAAQDTNPSWNGYYKGQQSVWSRALTKIVSNPALQ